MAEKRLILVVEDDEAMLLGLRHNLEYEGYETVTATDGHDALQKAEKLLPDLVLLDVMLPRMDGFAVLRELRSTRPRLPVILLTSKSLEADKLNGFKLGADDYVTKPFSIQELLARVRAVLHRTAEVGAPAEEPAILFVGGVEIDLVQRQVRRDGAPITLALKEYEMLRLFIRHRGEIVTREQLLRDVWGYPADSAPNTRTVDNHVAKLRQKLGADVIETIPKVGYKMLG
jgi:two-component system alkaline phosphatase synthesis response regulator PhoP